jgi:hypothetical protein
MKVRPAILAAFAGLVVGASLAGLGRSDPPARDKTTTVTRTLTVAASPPASTSTSSSTATATTPSRAAGATPVADPSADAAARAFFQHYLPVIYGQAQPSELVAVTPSLRRSLEHVTRRPPAALRHRKPRVVRITSQVQAVGSVLVEATVDDGSVPPFPLLVHVERQSNGRWLVSGLTGD